MPQCISATASTVINNTDQHLIIDAGVLFQWRINEWNLGYTDPDNDMTVLAFTQIFLLQPRV